MVLETTGRRRELRRRRQQGWGRGPLQQQGRDELRPPQARRLRVLQPIRQRHHIGKHCAWSLLLTAVSWGEASAVSCPVLGLAHTVSTCVFVPSWFGDKDGCPSEHCLFCFFSQTHQLVCLSSVEDLFRSYFCLRLCVLFRRISACVHRRRAFYDPVLLCCPVRLCYLAPPSVRSQHLNASHRNLTLYNTIPR